ncbi:MAG: ABC transporter permease [Deltaproteobacteria bacterium]|nr:ABC transporter permease [Deltaproteobacteria bacterium]
MDLIWQGFVEASRLLVTGDAQVLTVVGLSLRVSLTATLASLILGVPTGIALGLSRFRGRRFIVSLVNVGMGLPPVVVGLMVAIMLWRSGPFGFLGIMYSPLAIIIAQTFIAFPIVTALTLATIQQLNPKIRLQILALGASKWQMFWILVGEAKLAILAATIAGFGAVISEVGASMMVGGNILGQTRVLTTATVMETGKGNFEVALALSTILFALAYSVTLALTLIQQRERPL